MRAGVTPEGRRYRVVDPPKVSDFLDEDACARGRVPSKPPAADCPFPETETRENRRAARLPRF